MLVFPAARPSKRVLVTWKVSCRLLEVYFEMGSRRSDCTYQMLEGVYRKGLVSGGCWYE